MDILGLVTEKQREKELFIPAPKTSQLQLDIAGEPAASDPVPAWRSTETEAAKVVVGGAEPEVSAPKIHGMSLTPSAVSKARNQDKKGGSLAGNLSAPSLALQPIPFCFDVCSRPGMGGVGGKGVGVNFLSKHSPESCQYEQKGDRMRLASFATKGGVVRGTLSTGLHEMTEHLPRISESAKHSWRSGKQEFMKAGEKCLAPATVPIKKNRGEMPDMADGNEAQKDSGPPLRTEGIAVHPPADLREKTRKFRGHTAKESARTLSFLEDDRKGLRTSLKLRLLELFEKGHVSMRRANFSIFCCRALKIKELVDVCGTPDFAAAVFWRRGRSPCPNVERKWREGRDVEGSSGANPPAAAENIGGTTELKPSNRSGRGKLMILRSPQNRTKKVNACVCRVTLKLETEGLKGGVCFRCILVRRGVSVLLRRTWEFRTTVVERRGQLAGVSWCELCFYLEKVFGLLHLCLLRSLGKRDWVSLGPVIDFLMLVDGASGEVCSVF